MSFIKGLDEKIKSLKEINREIENIVVEILIDNKHVIIDMNTDDQLYLKGVDSDNVPIINREPYSPFTVSIKRQKGQPTDRVTLKDRGSFHGDFTIKKNDKKVTISSDDEKTFDLTMRYGDAIFGLIPENFEEIQIHYVKPEVLERLKAI